MQANRPTSVFQAVWWTVAAWAGWGLALAEAASWPAHAATVSCYLALSLTGCAAIAVLGARRPGVHAWNFVVVALLAVNLLPVAESFLTAGALQLPILRLVCLVGTLAVGVLNYLPTRFAPAALALLLGCAGIRALVTAPGTGRQHRLILGTGWLALAFTPWIAYASAGGGNAAASEFDRIWLEFRNRFGLFWSQRLREQFNRSAAHAGWPVILRWQGLRLLPGSPPPEAETQTQILATLRASLQTLRTRERRARKRARNGVRRQGGGIRSRFALSRVRAALRRTAPPRVTPSRS